MTSGRHKKSPIEIIILLQMISVGPLFVILIHATIYLSNNNPLLTLSTIILPPSNPPQPLNSIVS